jgi:hypothetical protein
MSDADDTKTADAGSGPPRKRSPNFPGISLPKAIERARQVYAEVKQYQVPMKKIVVDYWGYRTPTTGPASVTYAALKRYGLLTDEGQGNDRVAHLTDLALEILHPNPKREAAIKRAALAPDIFREWWEKYHDELPPDEVLEWEYVHRGPFADDGFATFLRVYRETIAFAKLSPSDSVTTDPEGVSEDDKDEHDNAQELLGDRDGEHRSKRRRVRERGSGVVTISLPLPTFPADEPVVIEFPGKLPEHDWEFFLTVVTSMKAGVVKTEAEQASENGD